MPAASPPRSAGSARSGGSRRGSRTTASSSPSGRVRVEPLGELARPAERDVVAAVHLVGCDAEPLAGMAARPGGGEEAVLAAEEVPGRRLGPSLERPWLLQRLRDLLTFSPRRLVGERGRDVVEEDVVVPALLVAGVLPP